MSETIELECADGTCNQHVPLTRDEYERIRSDSNLLFVLPGHEISEVEQIVEAAEKYVVVAKLGRGGNVADRLDPRKRTVRP